LVKLLALFWKYSNPFLLLVDGFYSFFFNWFHILEDIFLLKTPYMGSLLQALRVGVKPIRFRVPLLANSL